MLMHENVILKQLKQLVKRLRRSAISAIRFVVPTTSHIVATTKRLRLPATIPTVASSILRRLPTTTRRSIRLTTYLSDPRRAPTNPITNRIQPTTARLRQQLPRRISRRSRPTRLPSTSLLKESIRQYDTSRFNK